MRKVYISAHIWRSIILRYLDKEEELFTLNKKGVTFGTQMEKVLPKCTL
jgi:hypothetical protein